MQDTALDLSTLPELIEETPYRWRLDPVDGMRVPGLIYASRQLLPDLAQDKSVEQVANVATLPGIAGASYAMPDMRWGYGFPIGGVAATDVERGGVVSPGGVGFDISCGVRLLLSGLHTHELLRQVPALMDALDHAIPRGMGKGGVWKPNHAQFDDILASGARYAVEQGHGEPGDLEHCEDGGAVSGADPGQVSARARERGLGQVGSLGSGNHFLEVQAVTDVYDQSAAAAYGLWPGRVCVMIHTGSRGLGHQICSDFVAAMDQAMKIHHIQVPDRQLACAPVDSEVGRRHLAPGHADVGQPVLVPGSMGTSSYVLAGARGAGAFCSACHGAGRRLSRHQALRQTRGKTLPAEMEAAGIAVRGASMRGLAEEAPAAYKDVDAVVEVCARAGLARTVARLRPIGVVKG